MKVIVCGKWHNYLFRSKHSFQCIGKLRMKSYFITAVTILAALLLSSGGLLVTHAATTSSTNDYGHNNLSSQSLTMSITGGVASAGNQRYFIQQNGPALEAVVAGDPLVTSQLSYTLYANQQGLSTSGSAYFQLTGTGASGTSYKVFGSIQLSSSVAGACLPFLSATSASATFSGPCPSSYTSEVPAAFTGLGMVQIINTTSTTSSGSGNNNGNGNSNGYGNGFGTGDNGNGYGKDQSHFDSNNNPSKTVREAMAFENAYFNPFGDAITIASADNSIVILTNYTQATIDWSNVVDVGGFAGSIGTTPIAGAMTQVATEHENLVAGTAKDFGILTLSSVTNMTSGAQITYLDATGGYVGTSTIPSTGAQPCGIGCTETGFQDQGSFLLFSGGYGNNGAIIRGSYSTSWTVPAFAFTSTVNAKVTTASS